MSDAIKNKNRISMVTLFAMFALPTLLALWLLGPGEDWMPARDTNNGTLIAPARPLPVDLALSSPAGEPLPDRFLTGKWTLLYFQAAGCDELCMEVLHRIRQIRLAQGEETPRVQRLFVLASPDAMLPSAVSEAYPGLDVAVVTDATHGELLDLFVVDGVDPVSSDRVYMIDPLGNLMMYYEPTDEPNGILRDLRKLLKWSQIG